MLTNLSIRNFKRFTDVTIELGSPVVLIGPNNSGKTTALQALALWDIGLRRWNEKRAGKKTPEKRPGVTINRRDLIAVPVPDANLLWRDLHVRDVRRANGEQETKNIRIDILVEGVDGGTEWKCGLEFDYANEESFFCRPLRTSEESTAARMPVPPEAAKVRVAYLPPMSGLAANETRLDLGAINVRLGEGRTAEVLRNLCYQILTEKEGEVQWKKVGEEIHRLFGVKLDKPVYIAERGEINMSYRDQSGIRLDVSSAGRGLQQTLLLLAHLSVNPRSVLLLDEPDAHLEILRQRHIYNVLADTAERQGSQIIAASHSEVVLNEAADRHVVIAFVGTPHRIDDRGSQLLKALKDIGFDQYYQAEQAGWVLYLEGSTDLDILRALAHRLEHPAQDMLERPFIHYVGCVPQKARDHFRGLREAKRDLVGFVLFDRLSLALNEGQPLLEQMWRKREIENYVCTQETLLAWARRASSEFGAGPLFADNWSSVMIEAIEEVARAMETLGKGSPWSADTKVSDDFLMPLFADFFRRVRLPNLMSKSAYHVLAHHIPREEIDPEVTEVLDVVLAVSRNANPAI
jgi:ABC-type transport system involved in cytochrome c biogenesis ATPase subunit